MRFSPNPQDGYPRGDVVASCDVPPGTSRAVQDAALAFTEDLGRRGGRDLDLKAMVTTAEARFSNAFQTAADASASAMDVRTVLGDDVAERKRGTASPPSVAAEVRATSADATEPEDDEASDSERGGFGSEDELDSARSDADVSISADDDGTDHVGAEDNALSDVAGQACFVSSRRSDRHTHHAWRADAKALTPPVSARGRPQWFSNGCSIGCPSCEPTNEMCPGPSHAGKNTDFCGNGMKPTLPDEFRSYNLKAKNGTKGDKWMSTPWRAPGTAPVLDACGSKPQPRLASVSAPPRPDRVSSGARFGVRAHSGWRHTGALTQRGADLPHPVVQTGRPRHQKAAGIPDRHDVGGRR